MRRAICLLAVGVLALGGCKKDFDSQYAETENQLKADAARLDKEMAQEAKREPGQVDKKPPVK